MKTVEELKKVRDAAWDFYAKAKWAADEAYDAARLATHQEQQQQQPENT